MDLKSFCISQGIIRIELDRFFESDIGARFAEPQDKPFRTLFKEFRTALEDYAVRLDESHRHALFLETKELVERLNVELELVPELRYGLKESFLSEDEVNILIMKLLHETRTNNELAEKLGCTPEAIRLRMQDFKRGIRIGDMGVSFATEPGKPMRSTAHPIMLPLNLSEVYLLLNALGEYAEPKSDYDPHKHIAESLAQRIYYQLSDYGKSRLDRNLRSNGFSYMTQGVEPVFGSEKRVDEGHGGGSLQQRNSWLYHWKAGGPVVVICMGEDEDPKYTGYIHQGIVPDDVAEKFGSEDPCNFLVLKQADGTTIALNYADIIDIASA